MSEMLEKCSVCLALIDEEDLFCANCGREAPNRNLAAEQTTTLHATHNFQCDGCGASMSYDASAQNLRCPFCGSTALQPQRDIQVLSPRRIVPFRIPQQDAQAILRKWLGHSFWHPSDLAKNATIDTMRAVYVPYWVFSARTLTYWTADSSDVPYTARAKWRPVSGEHRGRYSGLLIGASSVLSPQETQAICPYDLSHGVPPDQVDLENAVFEQFRVQRRYARPLAQQGLEASEINACRAYVPGEARNVRVNVRIEGLNSEPLLVPVWIMAYRYKDQVYRFLINGQSGQATGDAPSDWKKPLLIAVIVGAAVLGLVTLFALCAGMGS
jgi:DNA-directed RNA polymerase subunit RPC12/RpoP